MGEKEYFKRLGTTGTARLRVRIETESGRIAQVVVQLEIDVNGDWTPVVRYDNAHGFPHRDVLDSRGNETKTELSLPDLDSFAAYAEQDLRDRWEWYKERFLSRHPRRKRT